MYESISVKTVLIEITNVCNLRCAHCYNCFDRVNDEKPVFMPLGDIVKIVEKCCAYDLNKLYLSGGEPFCHPDIREIIHMCGNYPDVYFTFTTNGLLLNEELIHELEKYKNICVQLSVDGLTREVYEKQRGQNTWDKFSTVLNLLIASKIKYLTARTCVTKINYREVTKIYEQLLDNNIMPSFIFVNEMGNAAKNWEDLALTMAMKLKVLGEINALNKKHKQNVSSPEPVSSCNFTENVEVKSLLIKYTGYVAPCQYFYSANIGNIFEQEISEILNYQNLVYYYDLAKTRKDKLLSNSKCQSCTIKDICGLGCLGLALIKGNPLGYDGECDYRMMTCAMYSNRIMPISSRVKEDLV